MDAIMQAESFIASHPASPDAKVLRDLMSCLQSGELFDVQKLYELNLGLFDLALEVLNTWRLQRYWRGGAVVAGATPPTH